MNKEEYIKKLCVCPFDDVNCPFWDYRYQKCDRVATSKPENKNKLCYREEIED